ncbi:3-oxoacyl-ACP reductase family protein [Sorangium cellulosum]|uniref:Oxidoreductase n=1 Tax=Sorangium cellulosum TaxID=56 RepID=A0A150QFT2_SORCE|nr:3-oxoacyl-ACP reductase family protein [Sorangium cellulosum]KYF66801.1 oxidoreductase [Sorangium cellulosum]
MGTLKGKVALVTGGSRGIGAAIARRLAHEGAAVAITYAASPAKAAEVVHAIEAAGGRAVAVRADSADAEAVKGAVASTVKTFGRIDVLVNNAGVAAMAPLDQFSLEEFDRLMAVNVRGLFVAAQEAARHMGQGGRIINIGSVSGDSALIPGMAVYGATKAAVAGLTRGWARDLGPRGITVNNVQPGPVDTDMNPADGPLAAQLKDQIPVQRYGQGDEIAGMVAYLAGPDGAFVTGADLTIDGGLTA